jgi:hypothetical protein
MIELCETFWRALTSAGGAAMKFNLYRAIDV